MESAVAAIAAARSFFILGSLNDSPCVPISTDRKLRKAIEPPPWRGRRRTLHWHELRTRRTARGGRRKAAFALGPLACELAGAPDGLGLLTSLLLGRLLVV